MKIKISGKCIGCGSCESVCGEIFGMKGDKAFVKKHKDVPCIDEALEICPVDAISMGSSISR